MYVHKEANVCFLAHPRTASRAVRDALNGIGFESLGSHHDGPDQGYDLSTYDLVFTGVRNHWDALVSWWFNNRMHMKELTPSLTWLAIHLSRNRYYFRAGEMWWFLHQVPGIRVYRFENMQAEVSALLVDHGLPEVEIPLVGVTKDRKRRHYSEFFDKNTRHFVEWQFLKEIRELGYRYEEV